MEDKRFYDLNPLYHDDPPLLYERNEYGYIFNRNNEHIRQLFDIYCSKNSINIYNRSDTAVWLKFEQFLRVFFTKEFEKVHWTGYNFSHTSAPEHRLMNNLITIITPEIVKKYEKAGHDDGKSI